MAPGVQNAADPNRSKRSSIHAEDESEELEALRKIAEIHHGRSRRSSLVNIQSEDSAAQAPPSSEDVHVNDVRKNRSRAGSRSSQQVESEHKLLEELRNSLETGRSSPIPQDATLLEDLRKAMHAQQTFHSRRGSNMALEEISRSIDEVPKIPIRGRRASRSAILSEDELEKLEAGASQSNKKNTFPEDPKPIPSSFHRKLFVLSIIVNQSEGWGALRKLAKNKSFANAQSLPEVENEGMSYFLF